MSDKKNVTETQLPVKPVMTVFFLILVVIALLASVAGENQKIKITGRKLIDRVVARDFDDAYDLLADDAKKRFTVEEVRARLTLLRTYLRVKYGPDFYEEYRFHYDTKIWIPWRGDNTRSVSMGLYPKSDKMSSELLSFFKTPPLEGPRIDEFFKVIRESGNWKILEITFDPEKYSDVISQARKIDHEIFSSTGNGFVFEGFVYDRRAATPEQRSFMLDSLKQAIHELEKDSGKKSSPSDDFMKMIP